MTADHTQARLQRIEDHLRTLQERVSVLSAVDDGPARERIRQTFAENPQMVIIYRGVQRGMTQKATAAALKSRGLPGAHQSVVSGALSELEEKQFVKKVPEGGYVPRDGWADFGLEKALKKALKAKNIDDLS